MTFRYDWRSGPRDRDKDRARKRELYRAARAAGVCWRPGCGRPTGGAAECPECRAHYNLVARLRYAEKKNGAAMAPGWNSGEAE